MKITSANAVRASYVENLFNHLQDYCGEDCGMITSNSFNFPIVINEEEGWVEVVVKVPKGTKDEEYDGYARRQQYEISCKEKAEKKKKAEADKAKKIQRDKERREKAK